MRSRSRRGRGQKRGTFWTSVWVQGFIEELGVHLDENGGNAQMFGFWVRWPSGLRETVNETGIGRTGELMPVDVTLQRTRVSLNSLWVAPQGIDVSAPVGFAAGISKLEDHHPEANDNVISFGAGPTAPTLMPHPILDGDEDWVWRVHAGGLPTDLTFAFDFNVPPEPDLYQSRAQRRLRHGEGLYFSLAAIELGPVDVLLDVSFVIDIRCLFKVGEHPPK